MKYLIIAPMVLAVGLSFNMASVASIDVHEFKNPEDETRYRALIEELRCPKCQNQNLAGSDAPIAQDLKQQTYQMINDGRSDTEIRQFMLIVMAILSAINHRCVRRRGFCGFFRQFY